MKQNVPALRFKEFEGEWEEKRLGDVVKLSSAKYNPITEQEVFKCIELEHLASDAGELLGYSSSDSVNSIKNRFNEGDVLFGKLRPYLKKYLQAPFDGVCSSEVWVLRGEGIANEFLYRIVQTENFIERANQSTGSKMPRADWSVVSESNVSIPSLPEQQKIASFLTAVDVRLQLLRQQKALLEDYKKGLMQRIFSQELRFKKDDGGEFEEWEEKRLGEVAVISSGLSKDQNDSKRGYRVTRIETISDGEINEGKVGFVDTEDDIEAYRLQAGDILFSNINSVSHIGKTAIVKNGLDLYHGMNLLRLQCREGVYPMFLFHTLNTVKLRVFFKTICNQAVSQASINQTALSKTQICIPSLAEQQKISRFLSAVDEKINLVAEQIAQSEVWKKGLMQGMFV